MFPGNDANDGELFFPDRQAMVRDQVRMSYRRRSGHSFRARESDPGVRFLDNLDVDIGHFIGREVTICRRIDNGMIEAQYIFLALIVPGSGVILIVGVEIRICAQPIRP